MTKLNVFAVLYRVINVVFYAFKGQNFVMSKIG